jgi:hypothetical protein
VTDTVTEIAPISEGDREIAYRSEANPGATGSGNRPAVVAPAGATGRRKEAIARVRIVPGSGQWTINGRDLENYFPNKIHHRHAGRRGGLNSPPGGARPPRDPRKVVELAVWGMLPKNRLSRKLIKKLKVYSGPEHPHTAQQPQAYAITQIAQ